MYGAFLRAPLYAGGAVLIGGLLEFIIPFILPLLGPEDAMLYRSFDAIAEYGLLVMLAAVAAGVLARAVVERNAGGVR